MVVCVREGCVGVCVCVSGECVEVWGVCRVEMSVLCD